MKHKLIKDKELTALALMYMCENTDENDEEKLRRLELLVDLFL